jgi:hypothetical protein
VVLLTVACVPVDEDAVGQDVRGGTVATVSQLGPLLLLYDELKSAQQVMLRDQAHNWIPSFDVHDAFSVLADPSDLEAECKRRSWFVDYIRPDARAALWNALRWGATQSQNV